MNRLITIIVLGILLSGSAFAQFTDHARRSRMSVMSKAGTPTPRAKVPNRTVALPAGAQRGYNYYYGRYRRSGGSYAAPQRRSRRYSNSGIPGLVTRPNSSKSRKRRRRRRR